MAKQKLGRVQWGDLTFGPGSPYAVTGISGLDDLPDIRSEDKERPGQHGEYTGPDYTGPRVVQLKLGLRGETPDDLRALSLALRNATQPQRQPAALQFLDQDILVWAKVRKRSIPYDAEYLWSIGDAALELYCADPYLYGLNEQSESTNAYSPSAGRSYPLSYGGATPLVRNIILNPSVETNLNSTDVWGTPTRARVTTEQYVGSASIEHTLSSTAAAGTRWTIEPVSTTQTIQVGVWVKLAAGVTWVSGLIGFKTGANTTLSTASITPPPVGVWTRVTASYTLTAGQTCDNVSVSFTPSAAGGKWYADAAQAEVGATLHDYIDGDQPGCTWETTVGGSPSRLHPVTGRTYGTSGTSGRLTAVNNGASAAYPVLRIDGPVAQPAIEQVTTGGSLVLDATLQAGEYVLLDTRTRAVLLMGTSPRRTWVRAGSVWPVLQPGHNEIAYRGSALPGAPGQPSLLTVTWRDTSL